jgi:hypothetical protein
MRISVVEPQNIDTLTTATPGWFVTDEENLLPVEMWGAVRVFDSNLNKYPVLVGVVLNDSGGWDFCHGEYVHDSYDGFDEYLVRDNIIVGDASWMTEDRVKKYNTKKASNAPADD